ncbi:unnamed protein product, partial [Ectocarpus sp. 8 AP-2014]
RVEAGPAPVQRRWPVLAVGPRGMRRWTPAPTREQQTGVHASYPTTSLPLLPPPLLGPPPPPPSPPPAAPPAAAPPAPAAALAPTLQARASGVPMVTKRAPPPRR